MGRLLVVYNICGIKKDNTENYLKYLEALSKQFVIGDLKIIVSACLPRERTLPLLKSKFPKFDYLEIKDNLPVNVTCNKAFMEGIKKYGDFDGYAYMSCDSLFTNPTQMQGLFELLKDDVGMVSGQIDKDSCYAYGLKLGGGRHVIDDENARREMFQNGDYQVPVGRACAAHFNIYSRKVNDYYGRCIPDIFAGYCTESVFTFVVSALKLKWIISKDHVILHNPSLDGPSSGQGAEDNRAQNGHGYDHPFKLDSVLPIFQNDYAKSLGLGYEECQSIVLHDPSQFDEQGFCKNEELKEYIKKNLYLPKEVFDYDTINCEFV